MPTICRVAILVPPKILSDHLLMKEGGSQGSRLGTATPPLEGYVGSSWADNRYHAVACVCVTALRGAKPESSQEGWVCLREGDLYVRAAKWEDPSAELLVTWLVPTFALGLAPPDQLEVSTVALPSA